jgi:hypothetical protein
MHAAVQRHAVHDRTHGVLANAEVHVAAGRIAGAERLPPLSCVRLEPVRSADRRAVRGAPAPARMTAPLAARLATLPFFASNAGSAASHSAGSSPCMRRSSASGEVGVRGAIGVPPGTPRIVRLGALRHRVTPVRDRLGGHVERFVARPAVPAFVSAISAAPSGSPCALAVSCAVGRPETDVRLGDDQGGALVSALASAITRRSRRVVHVGHVQHLPAVARSASRRRRSR